MIKNSDEERMLAAHALDLAKAASRGAVCYSDFLSPAQRSIILSAKELSTLCRIRFDGGYDDAERVRAKFLPPDTDYEPDTPISILEISSRADALAHRDVLGALLGLGISRGKIGDIIIHSNRCTVVCDKNIARYIMSNLDKVGRIGVKVDEGRITDIRKSEPTTITAAVMSLRLDSVTAEGFSIPRTAAAELIRAGLCFVNWMPTEAPSRNVKEGDIITLRGKGRIKLNKVGGQSRKGRTFIEILK